MSEQFKMTPEEIREAIREYGSETFEHVMNRYGTRMAEFRAVNPDDIVVADRGDTVPGWEGCGVKRFILRPKRKVTRTDVLFLDTGETRPPRKGEWYKFSNGFYEAGPSPYKASYPIYERVDKPREIEVDE